MSSASSQLKNKILRAGAGAGKTTTLTQTFLEFAKKFKEENRKFPRIVVTTFTRKATQELKERLLKKALDEEREDLFHYVSSKSQVQISTIHGVLSLFLSRYGSSIGLTPDYKIMSESEVRKTAKKIMRKYLLEDPGLQELLEEYDFTTLESALLRYFNEQVHFPDMRFIPQVELKKETERFIFSLSEKLRRVCLEIQQETSNDKWQEYTQAVCNFSWQVLDEDWSGFFDRLESLWEHNSKPVFRKTSAPFSLSLHEELDELRELVKQLLEESRFRPSFWEKHQKNCEQFEKLGKSFCQDFMQTKLEKGLLAMSDLEILAYKMIKEVPGEAVKFSQEWDYWMVDEYQDTSPAQVELLKHLIGEKPFFVVGDPQQSIYLFRGARAQVFDEKVSEVESLGGDVEIKLVNYRSSPDVLEFFNHYFTKMSRAFKAMTPAPDKTHLISSEPVVQVIRTETGDEDETSAETLSTVARIQELINQGVSPEQICVLGRTHKTLEEISKVAQEYGVPLQLHSGSGFYERREVLDALAIMKFMLNPHDNKNFVALLRSPWLCVADSEIATYCHNSRHSFWKEALKSLSSWAENHPLTILKNMLDLCETKGFSWTLRYALIQLGLFDYSARVDSSGRREANLWKVVALLSEEERRPGFNFLDFLDASLESLSVDEGGEDADATPVIEPKRVNFMTVHASKGLQFDHVIVPGMGQDPRASVAPVFSVHERTGLWTLKVRDEQTQGMTASVLADQITEELRSREKEEFLRVLYVALTRAKFGVTLLWDQKVGKKSWAALCPLNLEEGLHQEKSFSYVVRCENTLPLAMTEQSLAEKTVRLSWDVKNIQEVQRSLSVTELVSSAAVQAYGTGLKVSSLGGGLARAQQGTQAHKLFEALKFTPFEELVKFYDEDMKKPLEFIVALQEPPLMKIISQGHVEWGFALQHENVLMQGQIDLWGVVDKTLWLVDYKTGSQKFSSSAIQQLQFYAWALSKMKYLDQVETIQLVVVYPMDEVVKFETWTNVGQLSNEIEKRIKGHSLQT